jgi:hypothetical protein
LLIGIKFASIYVMPAIRKKILLIDDKGFCRICSAFLKVVGFGMETCTYTMTGCKNPLPSLDHNKIGLIITSYPYSHFILQEIKKSRIPFIILSDNIDNKLMSMLKGFTNSYCMIKPIDYQKFRELVTDIMNGHSTAKKGFSIV